jgi:hypothetical protein
MLFGSVKTGFYVLVLLAGSADKPSSPDEASIDAMRERDALNEVDYALKVPDDLIVAEGEAIRRDFRLDYVVDRLETQPDISPSRREVDAL